MLIFNIGWDLQFMQFKALSSSWFQLNMTNQIFFFFRNNFFFNLNNLNYAYLVSKY